MQFWWHPNHARPSALARHASGFSRQEWTSVAGQHWSWSSFGWWFEVSGLKVNAYGIWDMIYAAVNKYSHGIYAVIKCKYLIFKRTHIFNMAGFPLLCWCSSGNTLEVKKLRWNPPARRDSFYNRSVFFQVYRSLFSSSSRFWAE